MDKRVVSVAMLIFALMFIAVIAVLNTSIITLGTSANDQLNAVVAFDDNSLSVYDGTTVYGTTVIQCAKGPGNITSTDLTITVATADGNESEWTSATPYNLTSPNDAGYINNTARFTSELDYNTNGIVTGITFTQEGATSTGGSTN